MEDENEFETPCLNNKIIQVPPAKNMNIDNKQQKIPNHIQKSNNSKNDSKEISIFNPKERINENQYCTKNKFNKKNPINQFQNYKKSHLIKNRKSTSMEMSNNKKPDLQSPQYFISNLLYNSGLKNYQLNKMIEMNNKSKMNCSKPT